MTMTLARQGLGRKVLQAEGTVSAKALRGSVWDHRALFS